MKLLFSKVKYNSDIRELYKLGKNIGHGQFGIVRIAYLKILPGEEKSQKHLQKFAVKTIQKAKVKDNLHLLKREIELLQACNHPNIIKCYQTFEDAEYLHIVTEHCEGGELFDNIIQKGTFSEKEAATVFAKMVRSIQHLHENGICHRDIKPENFLFAKKDGEIKLIDFGLSNKFRADNLPLTTMVGTPHYVAPEVLTGKYNKECDI